MFYFSIEIKLKTKLKLSISPIIFVSTFTLYSKVNAPEPSIFMAINFSLIKRKSVQSLNNSGEILLKAQTKNDKTDNL